MQLRDPREHVRAHPGLDVERRPLVRVLAVGEVELLLPGGHPVLGELLVAAREPAADRCVVARRVRECLVRQPVPGRRGQLSGLLQLVDHRVVALGLHDHRDVAVVLRRRPDHRRPPDVDVLDRLVLGHVHARDRALERIEVHADQVDRLDLALAQRLGVLGVVAHREQRRVAGAGAASSPGRPGSPGIPSGPRPARTSTPASAQHRRASRPVETISTPAAGEPGARSRPPPSCRRPRSAPGAPAATRRRARERSRSAGIARHGASLCLRPDPNQPRVALVELHPARRDQRGSPPAAARARSAWISASSSSQSRLAAPARPLQR